MHLPYNGDVWQWKSWANLVNCQLYLTHSNFIYSEFITLMVESIHLPNMHVFTKQFWLGSFLNNNPAKHPLTIRYTILNVISMSLRIASYLWIVYPLRQFAVHIQFILILQCQRKRIHQGLHGYYMVSCANHASEIVIALIIIFIVTILLLTLLYMNRSCIVSSC